MKNILVTILLIFISSILFQVQPFDRFRKTFSFYAYWIILGFLSSFGLGSGLHTFTLYLAPFIVKYLSESKKCVGEAFQVAPYTWDFQCTENKFDFRQIFITATFWGIGTAIGELPPFMFAKSVQKLVFKPERRLSVTQTSCHFINIIENKQNTCFKDELINKVAFFIDTFGFFGIMAMASIPNPFFDLIGIACGHFDIPFVQFFTATLIGKSLIKANLQAFIVIVTTDFVSKQSFGLEKSLFVQNFSIFFEAMQICVLAAYLHSILKDLASVYHARISDKKT